MLKTKKLVILALYTTIALTIFTIESMIPGLAPIPGIKLGLSNIVTLVLLLCYTPGETLCVLVVRILLGSIITGQMMSFMYSFCGGMFCYMTMYLMNVLFNKKFIVLTSMAGALAHNTGQILTAFLLVKSMSVIAYVPILAISALITGFFTGMAAYYTNVWLAKLINRESLRW